MEETPEERMLTIRRMETASNTFYQSAIFAGCHAFIEFTGLMNEFIGVCRAADRLGIPWMHANIHGDANLPFEPHHLAYISEKLECIYGRGLATSDVVGEKKGVEDCIKIVKGRLAHYACYKPKPNETLEEAGMWTKPATFSTLEEILIFLEAHLERLDAPP